MRFPEFEGEWEEKRLGEVAEISSGGTPSRANLSYWNGDIPWVSTSLIDFNVIHHTDEKITSEGLDNSSAKLFSKGSLLMAMYGQGKTRGKVAILGIEATTNQACASIVADKNILNTLFLYQDLTKRYDEIRDLSNQGGQENLSGTIIKQIIVQFPSLSEQNKIANFLSIIDERIETQNKIIKELKSLKNELIDSLLGYHNKKDYLRFKKFDSEWRKRRLLEFCTFFSGGTPDTSQKKYYGGDIPFIRSGEINADKTDLFISDEGLKNSAAKMVETGDLLIALYGATSGDVAISKMTGAINQAILCIKTNENRSFLKFVLEKHTKKILLTYLQGGQGNLSGEIIKNLHFYFAERPEQDKISQFLSLLEDYINNESYILNLYQKQKQFLLTQMFI